jgi:hypothetical protein
MPIGPLLGPILGIGSALIGASSANKAANAQKDAANRDLAFQKETRDLIRADLKPYVGSGGNALAAYNYELGLGARPTFGGTAPTIETIAGTPIGGGGGSGINVNAGNGNPGGREGYLANQGPYSGQSQQKMSPTQYRVGGQNFGTMDAAQAYADKNPTGGQDYGGFTKTPGYDFRMQEGQDALESSAAARGGLLSGAALQASQQYGQNYATSEYDKYLAKLQGQQGVGLSASAMNATAAQNTASGVSNALGNYGDAASAGAIGVGNAFNTGIGNVLGAFNYQKNLTSPVAGAAKYLTGGGGSISPAGGGVGNWFSGLFK